VVTWTEQERTRRRHSVARDDQRHRFERDRDRILYSSAFRRLSGITQIVRAGEADVFHTREQHTIKVAQVGRRLAQNCHAQDADLCSLVGLHPEVVEAACLAHDLGHPPFGHVGEEVLHELVVRQGDPDGFEGNAQSFRIITKLAVRFSECPGLDLTRATLAACLKYPWMREPDNPGRSKKWGAYRSDVDDFHFARDGLGQATTAEAQLMDWADDIAYSVHDLEDFHRCGALPWPSILNADGGEQLVNRARDAWFDAPIDAGGRLREALRRLSTFLNGAFAELLTRPYEGTRAQRQQLRTMTSQLIGRYINAARLTAPTASGGDATVFIGQEEAEEVRILKQITRDYIINNPSLAAQQKGQRHILRALFEDILEDCLGGPPKYMPRRLIYLWDYADEKAARFAADCIAGLTEAETLALHARLHGLSSGSVLDPIVR
jgi:dGTPase